MRFKVNDETRFVGWVVVGLAVSLIVVYSAETMLLSLPYQGDDQLLVNRLVAARALDGIRGLVQAMAIINAILFAALAAGDAISGLFVRLAQIEDSIGDVAASLELVASSNDDLCAASQLACDDSDLAILDDEKTPVDRRAATLGFDLIRYDDTDSI